jgi:ABC-type iron transport system FetAB permease component
MALEDKEMTDNQKKALWNQSLRILEYLTVGFFLIGLFAEGKKFAIFLGILGVIAIYVLIRFAPKGIDLDDD